MHDGASAGSLLGKTRTQNPLECPAITCNSVERLAFQFHVTGLIVSMTQNHAHGDLGDPMMILQANGLAYAFK